MSVTVCYESRSSKFASMDSVDVFIYSCRRHLLEFCCDFRRFLGLMHCTLLRHLSFLSVPCTPTCFFLLSCLVLVINSKVLCLFVGVYYWPMIWYCCVCLILYRFPSLSLPASNCILLKSANPYVISLLTSYSLFFGLPSVSSNSHRFGAVTWLHANR